MSSLLCTQCRASLRRAIRAGCLDKANQNLLFKNISSQVVRKSDKVDIGALLSKPTWSVRSLLPDPSKPLEEEITPNQLHHLLRLSALPQPKSAEEEAKLLETLHSQLHFVRDIQSVDTEGVEPLQSIRDESEEGIKDATIGLETKEIAEALANEEVIGRNRRPRRRRTAPVDTRGVEDWDVTGTAKEIVETAGGKFFIVRSGKE
ncbi:hypothetical protein F5884DRAFT_278413 [Xylogone sp. PMI_703]|nr:hypothetical protein F5884DRAFT_278413 [Xylogone sp. PMI_703]